MPIISINGNTLDPDTPVPALRTLNLVQDTAQDSNYILIQTNGPLTKDIKRGLAEAQVTVQEKVSDDTYLCKYEPEVTWSLFLVPWPPTDSYRTCPLFGNFRTSPTAISTSRTLL